MQLSAISSMSPYIRAAVAGLALVYLLGVKTISSIEFPGIEIKFQEVPTLPFGIVCAIGFLEILLLIDLVAGASDKRNQVATDQDRDQAVQDQAKKGWTPSTNAEKTRAQTARLKSALGTIAFGLLYLLPMAVGIYCIIHYNLS